MTHTLIYPHTTAHNAAGHLEIGGCDVVDLAREFGTPLFIYDEQTLRDQCRAVGVGSVSIATICNGLAQTPVSGLRQCNHNIQPHDPRTRVEAVLDELIKRNTVRTDQFGAEVEKCARRDFERHRPVPQFLCAHRRAPGVAALNSPPAPLPVRWAQAGPGTSLFPVRTDCILR